MGLRPMWIQLASLLLVALGCSHAQAPMSDREKLERIDALYAGYRKSFPDVPEVTAQGLEELRATRPVVLVDVRSAAEREVSMIPGAIAAETFEAEPERYRDATVVTYCTIGYRSGLYAEKLRREGFDALNLKGSILAWTLAGGALVDRSGPTRRVHVYGQKWNLAGAGYEPVW